MIKYNEEMLLNAIILQGFNDYLCALAKNDKETIREVEYSFNNNPWLFMYYNINPDDLLEQARKEIRHDRIPNKRGILSNL